MWGSKVQMVASVGFEVANGSVSGIGVAEEVEEKGG